MPTWSPGAYGGGSGWVVAQLNESSANTGYSVQLYDYIYDYVELTRYTSYSCGTSTRLAVAHLLATVIVIDHTPSSLDTCYGA